MSLEDNLEEPKESTACHPKRRSLWQFMDDSAISMFQKAGHLYNKATKRDYLELADISYKFATVGFAMSIPGDYVVGPCFTFVSISHMNSSPITAEEEEKTFDKKGFLKDYKITSKEFGRLVRMFNPILGAFTFYVFFTHPSQELSFGFWDSLKNNSKLSRGIGFMALTAGDYLSKAYAQDQQENTSSQYV